MIHVILALQDSRTQSRVIRMLFSHVYLDILSMVEFAAFATQNIQIARLVIQSTVFHAIMAFSWKMVHVISATHDSRIVLCATQ